MDALVLVVVPRWLAFSHGLGRARLSDELLRGLVEANQRPRRIVRSRVDIEHGRASLGDLDMTPAFERREQHEEIGRPASSPSHTSFSRTRTTMVRLVSSASTI